MPSISSQLQDKQPSAIRLAQQTFLQRTDKDQVTVINTAIGNVSLPMFPPMQERLFGMTAADSPFKEGVVQYCATAGLDETKEAFLQVLRASELATDGLSVMVTDGGSQAMELALLAVTDAQRPLLLIEPMYTNYQSFAQRLGRPTVSVKRTLQADGTFQYPDVAEIERVIEAENPGAILVIPYDNPTGQLLARQTLIEIARLCVKHDLWLVSDEAYRELAYQSDEVISIWNVSEAEVPGITGRRLSLETVSKVFNACGLRVGALVSDNPQLVQQCTAEYTANLCANVLGQYVFGAVAHQSLEELQQWFAQQRSYYQPLIQQVADGLQAELPELIVSRPEAALYSVVDVRALVDDSFSAKDFALYCAREGKVELDGQLYTLLISPMAGFYTPDENGHNPGQTQLRIAFVETPEKVALVPRLFAGLLKSYLAQA